MSSNFEWVEIDLGDVRLSWKQYQSKALGLKNLFMNIPDLRNLISRDIRMENFAHVHVRGPGGALGTLGGPRVRPGWALGGPWARALGGSWGDPRILEISLGI